MKIVVDSSVAVKWLSVEGEQDVGQADLILEHAGREKIELTAPVFMKYEVGNALRYKKIPEDGKLEILRQFYDIPIKFYGISSRQAQTAFKMARAAGITFYDAVFMELAQRLKAVLVTANPKHQKDFPGVETVDLKDYKLTN